MLSIILWTLYGLVGFFIFVFMLGVSISGETPKGYKMFLAIVMYGAIGVFWPVLVVAVIIINLR